MNRISLPQKSSRPRVVYLLLAVNGFLIALMLSLAKNATALGVSPIAYAFWQTLIAGMILLMFSTGKGLRIDRHILFYCIVSGLTGIAVPNAIAFFLVGKIGAGFTGIMYALPPVFTLLIAVSIGLERLGISRFFGLLIAVMACIWIVRQRHDQVGVAAPLWYALGLVIPIMLSIGNVFRSVAWPSGIKAMPLASMTLLAASLPLAMLAKFSEVELYRPDTSAYVLALLCLQGGLTALTYLCAFELQKRSDPVFYSQLGAVAAVFGLLIGIVWFKESYSIDIWLGVLLVIVGLRVSNRVSFRIA